MYVLPLTIGAADWPRQKIIKSRGLAPAVTRPGPGHAEAGPKPWGAAPWSGYTGPWSGYTKFRLIATSCSFLQHPALFSIQIPISPSPQLPSPKSRILAGPPWTTRSARWCWAPHQCQHSLRCPTVAPSCPLCSTMLLIDPAEYSESRLANDYNDYEYYCSAIYCCVVLCFVVLRCVVLCCCVVVLCCVVLCCVVFVLLFLRFITKGRTIQ